MRTVITILLMFCFLFSAWLPVQADDVSLYSCVHKKNGKVRMVSDPAKCKTKTEYTIPISLNNVQAPQVCPADKWVYGFDIDGKILCEGVNEVAENTYEMNCKNYMVSDPLAGELSDFELTFDQGLIGRALLSVSVDIANNSNGNVYIQLKDLSGGNVLAVSSLKNTMAQGILEFTFNPAYTITGEPLIVHFETSGTQARVFNCDGTESFIPAGIQATGRGGVEQHMAWAIVKLR